MDDISANRFLSISASRRNFSRKSEEKIRCISVALFHANCLQKEKFSLNIWNHTIPEFYVWRIQNSTLWSLLFHKCWSWASLRKWVSKLQRKILPETGKIPAHQRLRIADRSGCCTATGERLALTKRFEFLDENHRDKSMEMQIGRIGGDELLQQVPFWVVSTLTSFQKDQKLPFPAFQTRYTSLSKLARQKKKRRQTPI